MTYRGTVHNGVVELDGKAKFAEGTPVQVIPVQVDPDSLSMLDAFGIWRDRDDIKDSTEAAQQLRRRSEQREDREHDR